MRGTSGLILIAVGLLALYIVLSDRYGCFVQFIDCLTGNDYQTDEGFTRSAYSESGSNYLPPSGGRGGSVLGLIPMGRIGSIFSASPRTPPYTG